ncbi:RNA polymerase sigma factor, sigma-70 family [Amycolatopsis marina]|uniref:RNA polymerase sigma factor, sigma-70 family n=1 Tax=Amycolatopsis marina TaxID=490629 RepID=A0A1I1A9W9_9PSEU|nr:sigma-70 family RNA polymerase sigma factor [Amycolatopsis marina]SFB34322.1 RNA polymerase sigma factor, sigma-70 family [Amycolatopsis marina]
MSTVPADLGGKSDAELIESVRGGQLDAYGALYERHVAAAYNLARQLARSAAEADDLVSEAFSKLLDTLRGGKGPDSAFRAYLLTALRHTAYDKTRRDRKIDLNEDMSEVGGPAAEALTVPFSDTAVAGLERSMAAKAFARLPERWQTVLWHTEIEQQSPAEVAPLLGLTANGVSALAYRAREGLRQAYLQVHLAETTAERCRATADRLGAWTRDGLSKRERSQVETHLDECDRCRVLAAELADVNGGLRGVVAPLVLGGAVFAYLAAAGATKASAATAGMAAVGAGAAAGTAGAAGSSGGAAAGAAAAGPRQFVGVAASGVAMAAAIAVGLTAGGGGQDIPAAAEPPPAVAPAEPAPPADPPQPPPDQPPVVPPAPQPEPPVVVPPPPAPAPEPDEPAPPPPPEEPEAPSVVAQGPPDGVELVPGAGPVDLPITVRNNGGSDSPPVKAELSLPPGVTAVGPNGGFGVFGGPGMLSLNAPAPRQAAPSTTVNCPGGDGSTVSCSSDRGLPPGDSVVLLFRLVAAEDAKGGQVTGTVSSGADIRVNVQVPVVVAPAPDDVLLTVGQSTNPIFPWFWPPQLDITVRNTGESVRQAAVTVDEYAHTTGGDDFDCSHGTELSCTSKEPLQPDTEVGLKAQVHRWSSPRTVTVTATLGTATASRTVTIDPVCHSYLCPWPDGKDKDEQQPPSTTPGAADPSGTSTSPNPPTSSETPESSAPGTAPTTKPEDAESSGKPTQPKPTRPSAPTEPAPPGTTEPSPTKPPNAPPTSKPWVPWDWWQKFG